MPIDFLMLPRPAMPEATVQFEVNGETVTLVMRKLDAYNLSVALEAAEAFHRTFGAGANAFPIGSETISITEGISRQLAVVAQAVTNIHLPIEQVLGIMVNLPNVWGEIIAALTSFDEASGSVIEGNS